MILSQERGRVIAGAVLILLGIAFFVMNFVEGLGQAVVLFGIGALLVAAYFYTRTYGFLIPGCILIGLGLGQLGETGLVSFTGFGSLALGVGFIAIYLIDWLYRGSTYWWPLIPGGILVVSSLVSVSQTVQVLVSRGWPLILVIIGLLILAGALRWTGGKRSL